MTGGIEAHCAGRDSSTDGSGHVLSEVSSRIVELFHLHEPVEDAGESFRTALAALEDDLRAAGHPASIHLVPHRESFDGSVSYDVLVRGLGRTLSVGLTGSVGLPWPRRGVVRADEHAVVRVNGTMLMVSDVVAILSDVFEDVTLLRRIVDEALLRDAVRERAVLVEGAELGDALDAWRRGHGLLGAHEAEEWMTAHGTSVPDLLDRLEQLVARRKLAVLLREELSPEHPAARSAEAALAHHLDEARELADIQWHWGRSEQTSLVRRGPGRVG